MLTPEATLEFAWAACATLALTFVLCALAAFLGILIFGLPVWLVLQRLKCDGLWSALVVGAALPPAVLAVLEFSAVISPGGRPDENVWERVLGGGQWIGFSFLSVVGVLVALVMWLFAYRRCDDPTKAFG